MNKTLLKLVAVGMFASAFAMLPACGGDDDSSGSSGNNNGSTGAGSNCTTDWGCVNGACECKTSGKEGDSCCDPDDCGSDSDNCDDACAVCS